MRVLASNTIGQFSTGSKALSFFGISDRPTKEDLLIFFGWPV